MFRPEIVVSQRGAAFQDFSQKRLWDLRLRSLADPRADDLRQWTDLLLAGAAAVNSFRLAAATQGTELGITLGGRAGMLAASGPTHHASAWNWVRAAALAMATRDADHVRFLCGLDETVFGQSTSMSDTTHLMRALRAQLTGGEPGPHLDAALAEVTSDDHGECLREPQVRLIRELASGDEAGFAQALAKALELHRQYYTVGDRGRDPDGLIPIEILGLACLAHDRGRAVGVESGYLPQRFVDGDWIGVEPDLSPYG